MLLPIEIAGLPVCLGLCYPDYSPLFRPYLTDRAPLFSVSLPPDAAAAAEGRYAAGLSPAYIEHMELCPRLSDALLPFRRVFFHGASLLWRGRAWIFSAPSGTGKTTQLCLWLRMWGDEAAPLCGDKPVLDASGGGITVCSSPWNGKENLGEKLSAPLGGVIVLEQARENRIRPLSVREALGRLFPQFFCSAAGNVPALCGIADALLRSAPVLLLSNRGDEASARLCRQKLTEVYSDDK